MLAKYKIQILLIILNLTFISFVLKSNNIEKIQIVKDNYYIESLKLINYKEKSALLKDKKASYYILNFWASWCAPCIKEMKSLNALQKKKSDIRVITISQDKELSNSIEFFKKNNYKQLEKYYDKDKNILSTFSIRGLPTTFIANKDFKVFAKVEGIIEWDSEEFLNWLYSN
jgi:thiol-disulfide isomerase/thioredoxin